MPRALSLLLALTIAAVLWGLMTHGTYAGTGDEAHYHMITRSLAFDQDMDLTNDYADEIAAFGGRLDPGQHALPGKDGRLRPVHDVGMPLLFAPYYAVAYRAAQVVVAHTPEPWLRRARLNFTVLLRHLLGLAMIGITAVMGVQLFGLFGGMSSSRSRAFAWAALLVLSPPMLSHGYLFFTEMLSALIALGIFMWLRGSPRSPFAAMAYGAATGYLLLVHARNVGLAAGLVGLAVYRSRHWPERHRANRLLAAFLSGAVVLLAVRTAITYHFWGTWITTPHARFEMVGWVPFVAESATRVAGWLFDQEDGLLPYAPIYLLAPVGWLLLWRRDRELGAELTVLIVAYVGAMTLPMLNVHGWQGGWSPAARFLVPVAPLLAVLTFSAVAEVRRTPPLVLIVVAVQVLLDVIVWQHPGLLWNNGTGTSALLNYLDGGTGRLSSALPSLAEPIGLRTIVMVAGAAVSWALFTALLFRRIAGGVMRSRVPQWEMGWSTGRDSNPRPPV